MMMADFGCVLRSDQKGRHTYTLTHSHTHTHTHTRNEKKGCTGDGATPATTRESTERRHEGPTIVVAAAAAAAVVVDVVVAVVVAGVVGPLVVMAAVRRSASVRLLFFVDKRIDQPRRRIYHTHTHTHTQTTMAISASIICKSIFWWANRARGYRAAQKQNKSTHRPKISKTKKFEEKNTLGATRETQSWKQVVWRIPGIF